MRVQPALPAPEPPVERRHVRQENQPWSGGDGDGDGGAQRDGGDGGENAADLGPEDLDELLDVLDAPE